MNSIEIFKCVELGCNIRCFKNGNDIWFRANDIAKIMGYKKERKAINDHVEAEYKQSGQVLMGSPVLGLPPNDAKTIYISEPGMYQLIFSSKLESAKTFTK